MNIVSVYNDGLLYITSYIQTMASNYLLVYIHMHVASVYCTYRQRYISGTRDFWCKATFGDSDLCSNISLPDICHYQHHTFISEF